MAISPQRSAGTAPDGSGRRLGAPPPAPSTKVEEYYFARLDNNPLVFEVKGEKFNDLFAAADDLRDSNLTRFEFSDVTQVTVAVTMKKK